MIIVFNKPYGMLSQFTPEPGSDYRTLAQEGFPPDVYAVGRLDADSEGLLLLSNEKGLPTSLLDPDAGHARTYWVQVDGAPTQQAMNNLQWMRDPTPENLQKIAEDADVVLIGLSD